MFDKVEYEYYAIIDGQEVKADDCFSNLKGVSYCKIGDYKYDHVPYKSIEISRIENYYFSCFIPIIIIFFLFLIIDEML